KGAEIADEAQADVVAVEFVDLVRERAEEQLLQRADFAGGAFPVFAGEGEQGQRTDPAAAAELDARTHRLLSRAVAERARPAPCARPAAVAVHDDRDVPRKVGRAFLTGHLGKPGRWLRLPSARPPSP